MYNSEWVAGVAIAALLLGLLLGVVLGRSSFSGRKTRDLEEELEASRKALEDYRSEVYDQFAETARKFETLNTSYNDLHRHLASSASTLLGDGGGAPLLKGPTESPLPESSGETIDGDAAPVDDETAAADQSESDAEKATDGQDAGATEPEFTGARAQESSAAHAEAGAETVSDAAAETDAEALAKAVADGKTGVETATDVNTKTEPGSNKP